MKLKVQKSLSLSIRSAKLSLDILDYLFPCIITGDNLCPNLLLSTAKISFKSFN